MPSECDTNLKGVGVGQQLIILPKILENCMQMKKMRPWRGGSGSKNYFSRSATGANDSVIFAVRVAMQKAKRFFFHKTYSSLTISFELSFQVHWTEQQVEKVRVKRGYIPVQRSNNMEFPTRDELAGKQWYLVSDRNSGRKPGNTQPWMQILF